MANGIKLKIKLSVGNQLTAREILRNDKVSVGGGTAWLCYHSILTARYISGYCIFRIFVK